eukprot:TRINITY_DN1336_c0_g1_i1.p1 TRINITY_DN1336_c0_g1~~TRINITY_DN1336_c0_g1_i1.p1  ORF type:complete len:116 (+),score=4.26 TRINITY_DN1336_c0_g1_i1:65-412(+)
MCIRDSFLSVQHLQAKLIYISLQQEPHIIEERYSQIRRAEQQTAYFEQIYVSIPSSYSFISKNNKSSQSSNITNTIHKRTHIHTHPHQYEKKNVPQRPPDFFLLAVPMYLSLIHI